MCDYSVNWLTGVINYTFDIYLVSNIVLDTLDLNCALARL